VRALPPGVGPPAKVALIAGSPGSAGSPSPGSGLGPGQVELAPLPLAGARLRTASPVSRVGPGALSVLAVPAASSLGKKGATVAEGWSVTGSGVMASAMEAEEAEGSGLASVRCGEPGSDIWFVGPGQQDGAAQIQLDLMNIDALAASVDVSVVTEGGPAQADGDTVAYPVRQGVPFLLQLAAAGGVQDDPGISPRRGTTGTAGRSQEFTTGSQLQLVPD
jgi:hypothetical protein